MILTSCWSLDPFDSNQCTVSLQRGEEKKSMLFHHSIEALGPKLLTYRAKLKQNTAGFIQDELPDLSPDEREFLLSGLTPAEWDSLFLEDDDEENGDENEG